MKVVFIAGAFRGATAWEIEQNVRLAEAAALAFWKQGKPAICPHTNTRFFQGEAHDDIWLAGYIEILKRCDEIYMVPGWQKSIGAVKELAEAQRLGLKIHYNLKEALQFDPTE